MMNYRKLAAMSALVAAGALTVSGPAIAATQITTDREASGLASQLLQDTRTARSALMNDDVATANHDIDEALAVRDKMLALGRTTGSATIVPIFSDLEDIAVVAPTNTVKAAPASSGVVP